jgi:surface polysaccharide O-acyltransferase-like enzyme
MERNYSIDFIKFFATVFVVCIHVNPSHDDFFLGNQENVLDVIVDTFARFAVPFFFIVSGYLFMNKIQKHPKPSAYLKKYTWNISKLYACWFVFYLLFGVVLRLFQNHGTLAERKGAVADYLTSSITFKDIFYYGSDTSGFQLWYLIALIWAVVIVFLFQRWKKIGLLMLISTVLYVTGLFGQSYSLFFPLSFQTRDALFFGLFYTVLGAIFALYGKQILSVLNARPMIYLASFFVFSALEIAERYWLVNIQHSKPGDYFISTIFLSASLFLFVLSSPGLGKNSFFSKVGKNSVGIYVVHICILNETYRLLRSIDSSFFTNSVVAYILIVPAVFWCSYYLYRGIQWTKGKLHVKPHKHSFTKLQHK